MSRNTKFLAGGAGLALLGAASLLAPVAVAQGASVYTEAQAKRGQESYKQVCGHCHRDDLTGGGSEAGAPALSGPIFTVRWRDQPLADMFVTIGTTMPKNKPDSMMPNVAIDIVSFILKANDFPAGKDELPPNLDALKGIVVTEKR